MFGIPGVRRCRVRGLKLRGVHMKIVLFCRSAVLPLVAGVTLMPAVALAQRAEDLPPHRLDTPVEMRVPGRIFLQLTPEAVRTGEGEEFISTMTRMFDGRVLRRYTRLLPGMVLLQVRPGDERVVAEIARMSREVKSIAWDTWGGTEAGPSDPRAVNGDMDFWRTRVCIDPVWEAGYTSSTKIVTAIIDTGINYLQPDLIPNLWENQDEKNGVAGVDDDGNGVIDDIIGAAFIWNDPSSPPACAEANGTLNPPSCWTTNRCGGTCEYVWNGLQLFSDGISDDPFDRDGPAVTDFDPAFLDPPCPCPTRDSTWLGHGTLTAAMIGARGNNALHASGVAWEARMMAVRVMDTPWRMPFVSDFIAALDYMIATPEVRVAAIPLTYEYSGALEAAAQAAVDNGIVLVCAAGNAGVHVPWPPPNGRFFPGAFANIKGVISVGASDCNDAPYQFTPPFYSTNWGETTVDVFAPGENRLPVLDGVYGFTSGASSLVAGIVSLYLAENPSATPADVEELIVNTARQVPVLQAFPANQNNPACRAGGVINAAAMFGLPASCPPIEPCDP